MFIADQYMLQQINFDDCYDDIPTEGPCEGIAYIVDGMELEIARPNKKEDELEVFSHKQKMCAVQYEGMQTKHIFQQISRKILTRWFSCRSNFFW